MPVAIEPPVDKLLLRLALIVVQTEIRIHHKRFQFNAVDKIIAGNNVRPVGINARVFQFDRRQLRNARHRYVNQRGTAVEYVAVQRRYAFGKRYFFNYGIAFERAVFHKRYGVRPVNSVRIFGKNIHFFFVQRLIIRYVIFRRAFGIFVFHAVTVSRAAFSALAFRVEIVFAIGDDRFAVIGKTPLIAAVNRRFIKHVARKQTVVAEPHVEADGIALRIADRRNLFAVNVNIRTIFRTFRRIIPAHKRCARIVEAVAHNHLFQIVAIPEIPVSVVRLRNIAQLRDALHGNVFEVRTIVEALSAQRAAHLFSVFQNFIRIKTSVRVDKFRHAFGQNHPPDRFVRFKRAVTDIFHRMAAVRTVVVFGADI